MPTDSNGNHTLPPEYLAVTGQTVLATQHNAPLEDLSSAVTGRLPRNGSAPMGANLPMAGHKITGLGDGTAAGDALTKGQFDAVAVKLTGPQTLTEKTLTQPVLTLKQSATPTPTAEGDIQWDSDDHVIAVGDSAGTQLFVPIPASTAAGDIEYFTGAKAKARLGKGTARQVLQMKADATAPEWATPIANNRGVAKAWVNFNGTGTVAMRDSFNVSSITDLGVGNYQANFTVPFANINYSVVGSCSGTHTGSAYTIVSLGKPGDATYPLTTGAAQVTSHGGNSGAGTDAPTIALAFYGDQ